ncbi:MAG: heme exporter protein CcmD [Acidobacteria bacterium]|nr:heme exporter protein CcmD [Acidobacteriota bacterium]
MIVASQWPYVVVAYLATFGSIAALVAATIVRGRRLSRALPDADKPWI